MKLPNKLKKKMNFIETIAALPDLKQLKIEEIARETLSTKQAVWRWLRGYPVPPLKRAIIARILGKSEAELWPEEEKEEGTKE